MKASRITKFSLGSTALLTLALTAGSSAFLGAEAEAQAGPKDGVTPPQMCTIANPTYIPGVAAEANSVLNDPACGYVDDFALLGNQCGYWGSYSYTTTHNFSYGGVVDINDLTSFYNAGVTVPSGNWMLNSVDFNATSTTTGTLTYEFRRYICAVPPSKKGR